MTMKKILLAMVAMGMAFCAAGQKATVNIGLKGAGEGARVVLSRVEGARLVPSDTLLADKKGRIHYATGDLNAPAFFGLALDGEPRMAAHLLLLPGEKVTMNLTPSAEVGMLMVSDVTGSDNMKVYAQYCQMVQEAVAAGTPQAVATGMEQLVDKNPDQLMSAFLVTYFEQAFDQYAPLYKKVRDALIGRYPNNDFVRHLDDKLRSSIGVGMEAPDIALADADGNIRHLSSLRGKVVLVDFWASWCRPCRMENPNVVRLYQRFHDKGFEIFSVSLDNNRGAWLKAIADDHLDWPNHVSDLKGWQSAGGKLYGIQSIPATVLVDAEGRVLARNLRGAELERKLTEIFGNN